MLTGRLKTSALSSYNSYDILHHHSDERGEDKAWLKHNTNAHLQSPSRLATGSHTQTFLELQTRYEIFVCQEVCPMAIHLCKITVLQKVNYLLRSVTAFVGK